MIQNDYEIESIPESAWQVSRRSFMKRLAGGIAAGGALVYGTSASASPKIDAPQDLETAVSARIPATNGTGTRSGASSSSGTTWR